MTSDEAGRPKEVKNIESKGSCLHTRMVDYHYDARGTKTDKLICKECGEIIPDPLQSLN